MGLRVRTRQSNKKTVIVGLAIVGAAVIVGVIFWQHQPLASPFTTHDLAGANTNLYYPSALPSGYSIDYHSVQQPQAGITTLSIKGRDHSIYMSEQALPKNFDLQQFYKNLDQNTSSNIPAGKLVVGMLTDSQRVQRVASVTTNDAQKTWIIINADSSVPANTLQQVAAQLIKNK